MRGYESAPARAHRLADVRVASWNILHDGVPAETITALAQENAVDAVALLEVSTSRAQEVVDALAAAGRQMTLHYAGQGGDDGTALLLSPSLGGYSVDTASLVTGVTPPSWCVRTRPTDQSSPPFTRWPRSPGASPSGGTT